MIWKKIILLIVITSFIAGCSKDLLDVDPKNQVFETNYYGTQEELEAALISAYDPISWVFYYGASTFVTLNVASDDANAGGTPGGQDIPAYQGADKFTLLPNTERIDGLWLKYYAGVYRTNILLEKADPEDEDLAQIIAEAKFLRAYYYFDLVRYYGDVVLLDHPATVEEYSLPRTPAEEVYAFIVKDLQEAIPHLKEKTQLGSDQLFRATKSAAQTLLGKVYLFMSSPANNFGDYYQ
jgi:starch-binding outer membrane protein, SusD/RagB family